MEIERKWLIDKNNIPYNLNDYDHLDIEQAYISFKPTVRIRKISNLDEYILTIKSSSKDNGLSRQEYELNISEQEYNNLLNKKEGIVLTKTRYRVKDDGYLLEIDLFHNDYEGLAYMEIEFETVEKAKSYIAPNWVLRELTGDHNFTNAALALKKYEFKESNMTKLNETELESVAGGTKREKTIRVQVDIPDVFNEDIIIKAYVDGQLDSSLSTTVDSSVRVKYMDVRGTSGIKQLRVKLNNTVIIDYELDFDSGSYVKIG